VSRNKNIQSELGYTDRIHRTIAIPRFYDLNGFNDVQSMVGTSADLHDGIDYIATVNGDPVTIQERFRRYQYRNYGDITFRYDSKMNRAVREYFKIKADYFLYGVVNQNEDDFEWAAFVVVPDVLDAIANNDVPYIIRENKGVRDSRFIAVQIDDIEQFNEKLIMRIK
jgi:hypothetical protein